MLRLRKVRSGPDPAMPSSGAHQQLPSMAQQAASRRCWQLLLKMRLNHVLGCARVEVTRRNSSIRRGGGVPGANGGLQQQVGHSRKAAGVAWAWSGLLQIQCVRHLVTYGLKPSGSQSGPSGAARWRDGAYRWHFFHRYDLTLMVLRFIQAFPAGGRHGYHAINADEDVFAGETACCEGAPLVANTAPARRTIDAGQACTQSIWAVSNIGRRAGSPCTQLRYAAHRRDHVAAARLREPPP